MKQAALLGFLIASFFISCSQSNIGIKKLYAYRTVRTAGTIPVDENGVPVKSPYDTSYVVYAETGMEEILWQQAWMNGREYSIVVMDPDSPNVEIGIDRTTHEKVFIKPGKGTRIWKLELVPSGKKTVVPREVKENEILLHGEHRQKKFYIKTGGARELRLPDGV